MRNYVRVPYVNRLMNERLLAAEPDAVDRISASFAMPARDWYAELLAAGRAGEGWRRPIRRCSSSPSIGLCEFLFSARPLLERGFGESLDAELVEQFSAEIAELVIGGVRGPAGGDCRNGQLRR